MTTTTRIRARTARSRPHHHTRTLLDVLASSPLRSTGEPPLASVRDDERRLLADTVARWKRQIGSLCDVDAAHIVAMAAADIDVRRVAYVRAAAADAALANVEAKLLAARRRRARKTAQALARHPAATVAKLQATPEGCDWLIARYRALDAQLAANQPPTPDQIDRLLHLAGQPADPATRQALLTPAPDNPLTHLRDQISARLSELMSMREQAAAATAPQHAQQLAAANALARVPLDPESLELERLHDRAQRRFIAATRLLMQIRRARHKDESRTRTRAFADSADAETLLDYLQPTTPHPEAHAYHHAPIDENHMPPPRTGPRPPRTASAPERTASAPERTASAPETADSGPLPIAEDHGHPRPGGGSDPQCTASAPPPPRQRTIPVLPPELAGDITNEERAENLEFLESLAHDSPAIRHVLDSLTTMYERIALSDGAPSHMPHNVPTP
jgi:hypothetical protein